MKILIVGSGSVGATIAKNLASEGHNIILLDLDEQVVRKVSEGLDILGLQGSGVSLPTLMDASVNRMDMVIAVTDSDEKNLLCCLLSKKAGAGHTIARIRNPEYKEEVDFLKDDFGLSLYVNPEYSAAMEIARLLKLPTAMEIDTFSKGLVEILKFEVKKENPVNGVLLKNLYSVIKADVLICIVEREGEIFIPKGDFTIREGDKVSFAARPKEAVKFFKAMNMNQGRAKNVIISGGSEISFYLAKELIDASVSVKIIVEEKERADELAEKLPQAVIIRGNASEKELLLEEGIKKADAFVSLDDKDEVNVMLSIYAKKENPQAKIITKVHKNSYEDIIKDLNLGSVIDPKLLAGEYVVKYVRALNQKKGSSMETLYQLNSGKAEALEFIVDKNSRLIKNPLCDLKLKENVIIAAVIHEKEVIIPKGQSVINSGDRVIVVTTEKGIDSLDKILEN